MRNTVQRPRKRPPLRSYIPFGVFMGLCLLVVLLLFYLVAHLLGGSSNTPAAVLQGAETGTMLAVAPASSTPAPTVRPGDPTYTPAPPTATAPISQPSATGGTPGGVQLQVTPGGALPTRTPPPTATATGRSLLVSARGVDSNDHPLNVASRFVSPALRIYAVATVRNVHQNDVLRFVFERNGLVLPHDDITYTAGINAPQQLFHAFADYAGGAKPLPHGQYRVLFYRNSSLEAVHSFRIG